VGTAATLVRPPRPMPTGYSPHALHAPSAGGGGMVGHTGRHGQRPAAADAYDPDLWHAMASGTNRKGKLAGRVAAAALRAARQGTIRPRSRCCLAAQ